MTRETKSYELKIYDQSLMRFEAAYDAFGSLKLEITDIDSANAHLLPLNLIVDQVVMQKEQRKGQRSACF